MVTQRLAVVALVGRTNVGKSSLFNRLTDSQDALVADRAGVTRDRQYGYGRSEGQRFILIDTGGLTHDDADIEAQATEQVDVAIAEADGVILVVDQRAGLTTEDQAIANRLRRGAAPVWVAVNKSEGLDTASAGAEFHALGLGMPWPISAQRGQRVAALIADVLGAMPSVEAPADDDERIRLALLGRPNVGKSSLVNRLIGETRMLTQDQAGTTRDAITSQFSHDDARYLIVDTAGIRRQARTSDALERLGFTKAMQAIEQAQVAIVMIDGATGLTAQDIRLLGLAVDSGRGVVIAVNKWDRLGRPERAALHAELVERLPAFQYLPLCFISAADGTGIDDMLAAARASHRAAFAELSTAALSRALEDAITAHPPPTINGRRIKLRYAHQGGRNPPRIVIHGNQTGRVPASYKRYLMRCFRESFDLFNTPVELVFRTANNPYDQAFRG